MPTTETTVERKPPTIADIVRQKTDDGARIIEFFLGLMEGYVADAKLCHRIDAAKQLVKYGSKEAADFIAEHRDETCDHCESRKRGPRPRKDASQASGPPYAAPHLTPDFLTLLTEDFFDVLSAVDEDLMIMLVRGQTRDGDAIVEFLDSVMHGREDGFKPHHRIAAAKELISHIIRDEHRSHTPSYVGAGLKPALPGAVWENGNHPSVVPAKAGTQRGGGARSAADNSAGAEPVQPTVEEPKIVRPEPVLSTAEGLVEEPGPAEGSQTRNSKPGTLPRKRPTRTQRCREGAARAAGQRIERKLVAHWHEPDPWDRPTDARTPGRSPPS